MKKTLTVNLGGTVFHIDEDAYRLLDNYLCNLRLHFHKQEGAEEIVNDIENRISELFAEKLSAGSQVITIADVEEVIARMGKPEDFGEDTGEEEPQKTTGQTGAQQGATIRRRLYRNPDDKILGGVISGLAAYLNWDVTVLRLIMFVVLICGYGVLIPIYIICWLVIPEARTAAEKLNMRGEDITIENIGRTVTDGFERMANGVNNYVNSGKPRSFLQKVGDALVSIAGFFLKACLVVLAIICSPVLFVLASSIWNLIKKLHRRWSRSLSDVAFGRLVTIDLYFSDDDYRREHCRSCLGRYSFSRHHFRDSPANLQLVSYVIRTEMVTVDYMDTGCRYFCHQPLLPGMALSFPLGRMT